LEEKNVKNFENVFFCKSQNIFKYSKILKKKLFKIPRSFENFEKKKHVKVAKYFEKFGKF